MIERPYDGQRPHPEVRFWRGVAIAIPVGLALWVGIGWALWELLS